MGAALVGVLDWDWLSLFVGIWQFPHLGEVSGALDGEKVIAVVIGPAWSLQWFEVFTDVLGAEGIIVADMAFVDVLAWVAVPKGVLSVLLPPFTFQRFNCGCWVNFWEWAGSVT